VVADDRERPPALGHVYDDAQYVWRVGSAVDEIADEEGAAAFWRRCYGVARIASAFELHPIAKLCQQLDQLVGAAVHVADDVEWPAHIAPVGSRRCHDN